MAAQNTHSGIEIDSPLHPGLPLNIEGEIPRLHFSSPAEFERHINNTGTPVILSRPIEDWPAMGRWNLDYFKETYGNISLPVSTNLPDRGAVYDQPNVNHQQTMKLADIIELILQPDARPCYTHQRPLSFFPGCDQDIKFEEIIGPQLEYRPSVNLWIGSKGTRSGLHFDRRNNLLAQILGRKWLICCPPGEASKLYQFRRNIDKSRVDPEHPDIMKYPMFSNVRMKQAILLPGDILYIPRLWWHFVRSLDPAISVNYWFGPTAPFQELMPLALSAGLLSILSMAKDFVWHGALGQPHATFLHTGRPSGALCYDKLIGWRFKG